MEKLFVISSNDLTSVETPTNGNSTAQSSTDKDLQIENICSIEELTDAQKRGHGSLKQQSSVKINEGLAKDSDDAKNSYWNWLHILSILCCCGLAMSMMTLMPRHNSILEPSYWFEVNITTSAAYFMMTAMIVLDFWILFGRKSFVYVRFFLKNYLATFLTWIIYFCLSYMIWTMILEYNHPMPMVNQYGFL